MRKGSKDGVDDDDTECILFHHVNAMLCSFINRVELLSFAMIHCSTDMLEPIIRAKCLLQTQV